MSFRSIALLVVIGALGQLLASLIYDRYFNRSRAFVDYLTR